MLYSPETIRRIRATAQTYCALTGAISTTKFEHYVGLYLFETLAPKIRIAYNLLEFSSLHTA